MNIELLSLFIIATAAFFSYRGFKDASFFAKYSFHVHPILTGKEYVRLISSGFLHGSWTHFAFNAITLWIFSGSLDTAFSNPQYLIIFFASLVGGNLFSLYIHKSNPNYRAIGASGAVSGVIFASIAVFPGMRLGLLFLPIFIPAWLFGLAYILYSIYGIRTQKDNIGHEAHLGGGIIGMLIAIAIAPESIVTNYLPILCVLLPTAVFLYLLVKRPQALTTPKILGKRRPVVQTIDDKYNEIQVSKQEEIDALLDKISRKGMKSLSKKEKARLDELTK